MFALANGTFLEVWGHCHLADHSVPCWCRAWAGLPPEYSLDDIPSEFQSHVQQHQNDPGLHHSGLVQHQGSGRLVLMLHKTPVFHGDGIIAKPQGCMQLRPFSYSHTELWQFKLSLCSNMTGASALAFQFSYMVSIWKQSEVTVKIMILWPVKSDTADRGTLQKKAVVGCSPGKEQKPALSFPFHQKGARLCLAYLKLPGVKPDCKCKEQFSSKACKLDRQTVWKVADPFSNLI